MTEDTPWSVVVVWAFAGAPGNSLIGLSVGSAVSGGCPTVSVYPVFSLSEFHRYPCLRFVSVTTRSADDPRVARRSEGSVSRVPAYRMVGLPASSPTEEALTIPEASPASTCSVARGSTRCSTAAATAAP